MWHLSSPMRDQTYTPLLWNRRVLTTGPLGKPHSLLFRIEPPEAEEGDRNPGILRLVRLSDMRCWITSGRYANINGWHEHWSFKNFLLSLDHFKEPSLRRPCISWLTWALRIEVGATCVVKVKVTQLCPTLCDPMDSPWDSPGQNTGVGSLSLLQGIFPTHRSKPRVSHIAGRFFTGWATWEAWVVVPVNKHLWGSYYVPGTVQGAGDERQIRHGLCSAGFTAAVRWPTWSQW